MLIQINTARHIEGDEALAEEVRSTVADKFDRFSQRITRVEVHLSDEDSDKKAVSAVSRVAASHITRVNSRSVRPPARVGS